MSPRGTGACAIVTGAAGGIGLETARLLRATGRTVVAVDLKAPPRADGTVFVQGDVRDGETWQAVVRVAGECGGPDVVVLNAGIASPTPVTLADAAAIERVVDVNLLGVINGVAATLPRLRAGGGGAIVATASLAGLIPYAPDPVYAAAKHAVVGFVRSIAPALESEGITANVVCPGLTDTPILPGAVRAAADREGFALIAPAAIAAAIIACVEGDGSGDALVCQAGRAPVAYRFRGVPGPAGGRPAPSYGERLRA